MAFFPASVSADLPQRLKAFPFVTQLSEAGRKRLCEASLLRSFEPGTRLLGEGSPCEALLLVERGGIRVFKSSPGGRQITLYQVTPGESCVLGTSCLLGGNCYPAEAVIEQSTDAIAVPAPVFTRLFDSEAAVRHFVMDLFADRLAGVILLVEEIAFRKMDERLAGFLLAQAGQTPGVLQPVTLSHEQMATHLGTAREVISRLLLQFAEEGLVRLERRLVQITDQAGLRRRTCQELG